MKNSLSSEKLIDEKWHCSFPIFKRTITLCKFHPFHYISKDEMNLHLSIMAKQDKI